VLCMLTTIKGLPFIINFKKKLKIRERWPSQPDGGCMHGRVLKKTNR
jgi:hypothetical protein